MLAGHGITPDPLHDDIDVLQGHARKRKIRTVAPRFVEISIDLSEVQAAAYDDWFENALVVGVGLFTAEIAALGANSRYWAAQWVGSPLWTPRAAGRGLRWRLSGRLLLTGAGSDAAPLGATLATEYVVALSGTAAILSGATLATEYVVALTGALPLTTDYVVALMAYVPPSIVLATEYVVALMVYEPPSVPLATEYVAALTVYVSSSFELREDGGIELREDGGIELRQESNIEFREDGGAELREDGGFEIRETL